MTSTSLSTSFVLSVLRLCVPTLGNACADTCDQQFPIGSLGTVNAVVTLISGLETRNTTAAALDCYKQCLVQMLYPGRGGCPNFCHASLSQGACQPTAHTTDPISNVTKLQCACAAAWQGADCSLVRCPQNTCSGRGTCVPGDSQSDAPDRCVCAAGFGMVDCSVPLAPRALTAPLPFGDVFSSAERPYWQPGGADAYLDEHPLLNLSRIMQWRLTVDVDDWFYLLNPANQYNQSYVKASLFFDNGVITVGRSPQSASALTLTTLFVRFSGLAEEGRFAHQGHAVAHLSEEELEYPVWQVRQEAEAVRCVVIFCLVYFGECGLANSWHVLHQV